MTLTALGKSGVEANRDLETFERPGPPWGTSEISLSTDEVTSLCPITKQPDFTSVTVSYCPKDRCIESKSLKLYLQSFRSEGVFVEAFANRVADDLFKALDPRWLRVICVQKPRGGITIQVEAHRRANPVS